MGRNGFAPQNLLLLFEPFAKNRLSEVKPSAPRPHIEGLSDLVFGLALSIGAFQLVGNLPQDSGDLIRALAWFGFSFLILINVWLRYTSIASVVPVETTAMVRLNILLLFLVVLEPYTFNILTRANLAIQFGQDVSAYYAVVLSGMNLVMAYFIHLATREKKELIPAELTRRFKPSRNYALVVGLIFAISAIPVFSAPVLGTSWRIVIWILVVPVVWLSRIFGRPNS